MSEKQLIWTAKFVSIMFTPFYLPLTGMVGLFLFSYLSILPLSYKLFSLLMVYFFTVLLPTFLIRFYRNYHGWTLWQLGVRERRMMPYAISIFCYFLCFYLMNVYNMPHFMSSILIAALLIQVFCAIVNNWWKISTHSAAIGGVTGALPAFSFYFHFNPVWWLCLVIGIAGLVCTSRMILRQHTLAQVGMGFLMGFVTAFLSIIWLPLLVN